MEIACLPEGTYGWKATVKYSTHAKKVLFPSIFDIFMAVKDGKVGLGMVPGHTLRTGFVEDTNSGIFGCAGTVNIIDAITLPIKHSIGKLKGSKNIEEVISKKEALDQCSDFLDEHYPNAKRIPANSTVDAMQMITKYKMENAAAIGGRDALIKNKLEVIASDIAPNNRTLFFVIGLEGAARTINKRAKHDHITYIIFNPPSKMNGVIETLGIIEKYNTASKFIYSKMQPAGRYAYLTHLDGRLTDNKVKECISEIKEKGIEVVPIGSFPDPLCII